jgi:hypothetical protein
MPTNLSTLPGFSTGGSTQPYFSTDFAVGDVKVIAIPTGDVWTSQTYSSFAPAYVNGGQKAASVFTNLRYGGTTASNSTNLKCTPITVSKTTGGITLGTPTTAWTNSNILNYTSTIYHKTIPYTGFVFAGGNVAWPGNSTYALGYSYFFLDADGVPRNVNISTSNADHGYNYFFSSLPNASNYYMSSGYQGSYGGYRRSSFTLNTTNIANSTASIGSWTQAGSWTSSSNGVNLYSQPGVTQTGTQVVSGIVAPTASPNYPLFLCDASGTITNTGINTNSNAAHGFQKTDGSVIIASYTGENPRLYTSTTSSTVLTNFALPFRTHYANQHIGLGNDRWLSFDFSSAACYLWNITASNTVEVKQTWLGAVNPLIPSFQTTDSFYPIYGASTDAYPKYLLQRQQGTASDRISTYVCPDFSKYF